MRFAAFVLVSLLASVIGEPLSSSRASSALSALERYASISDEEFARLRYDIENVNEFTTAAGKQGFGPSTSSIMSMSYQQPFQQQLYQQPSMFEQQPMMSYQQPGFLSQQAMFTSPLSSKQSSQAIMSAPQTLPLMAGETTYGSTAAIETQALVNTNVIKQPVIQTQTIQQPYTVEKRVIQPILKTRILTQPVIRPVITNTVIVPKIQKRYEIQRVPVEQTVVVPQIMEKTEVRQVFMDRHIQNAPITAAAQKDTNTITSTIMQPQQPIFAQQQQQPMFATQPNFAQQQSKSGM